MANDFPRIIPWDTAQSNQAFSVNFQRTFVDEPKNHTELPKDYHIGKELETVKFQQAFIRILIGAYTEFRVGVDKDSNECLLKFDGI